jgi:muconolactone delta-isomerase
MARIFAACETPEQVREYVEPLRKRANSMMLNPPRLGTQPRTASGQVCRNRRNLLDRTMNGDCTGYATKQIAIEHYDATPQPFILGESNMLFMLKATISKPGNTPNKEFYSVWRQESEAALMAVRAGAIKAIWKVGGRPVVIAVLDLPSADDLDHAIHELPIWKLGYSHIVSDLEILPLRPYEHWAEDLKKLSQ